MAVYCSIFFIVFSLLNGAVHNASWNATSLPDGQHLYPCVGDNLTLTWKYTLQTNEELADVRWLYNGHSQELVAIFTQNNFLPTPSFSQRVTWVDNAGISLFNVLVADSGSYSVEVNVYSKAGSLHNLMSHTAAVQVSDRLMTTDGALHVVQDPDPFYNNATGKWVIQLQCGHFIFQDNPPIYVEWTTPSGHVYNSTSFSQGIFYFHIPMPVETGNYVCSIPTHLTARACLHGNVSKSRVAVRMDSVEARLLLLEKENWDLKTRLEKLEDAERNQVAFHATGASALSVNGKSLVFDQVFYNQGNAYNSSTGFFTAPYSGLYFFIGKTAAAEVGGNEFHYLQVDDDLTLDMAHTDNPMGRSIDEQSPVYAVVHLTQGQQVSVTIPFFYHLRQYSSQFSTFTGFLLSRDP